MVKEHGIRWGMTSLSALCLIGIGVYLAQLVWLALAGVSLPKIHLTTKAAPQSMVAEQAVDIAQIQKWQLFGAPQKKQFVAERPVEAPKTTLKLELLGVFLGQNGALSTAIIGEIGKDADYYKEGDAVARGVELKEVYASKVILSRNGRYETLAFAENRPQAGKSSVAANRSGANRSGQNFRESRRHFLQRSARSSRANTRAVTSSNSAVGRMAQSGQTYTPDKIVEALKQDLVQNPQAALQDMGLVANGAGGYVIGSDAPASLLQAMGLRTGDRVMTVNGQTVSGSASDSSLIQSAMQQSNVKVEIQRGARTFTLNVPVPR